LGKYQFVESYLIARLQLFHLLEHKGEGGNTLLVDGFYLAQQMQLRHPDAYRVLTTTPVKTHSAGDKDQLFVPSPSTGYPIIRVASDSHQVFQVNIYQFILQFIAIISHESPG
jgi:trimethyllysine dioxygenase